MATLIARWTLTQDPVVDRPEAVFWSDGCRASYQDLLDHLGDTHELVETADGHLERRMYPFLLADVRYDGYVQMWFVMAPGEGPIVARSEGCECER